MRIGIDIDDTITDTYPILVDRIAKHYGMEFTELYQRKLTTDEMERNSEEFPDLISFEKEETIKFIYNVDTKENAVEVINKLHEDGHQIIIITARSKNLCINPYELSFNYLIRQNILFDKLIVGAKEKGKIAKEQNVDIFIDDNVRNCTNTAKEGIETLIFDNVFNENCSDFKRVNNWLEIYTYIKEKNNQ